MEATPHWNSAIKVTGPRRSALHLRTLKKESRVGWTLQLREAELHFQQPLTSMIFKEFLRPNVTARISRVADTFLIISG